MTTFREPIKVVADVLAHEMALDAAHLMLNDEKWDIPKDDKIFAVLSYIGPSKVIANRNGMDDTQDPPLEVQQTVMMEVIQIDIMSQGSEARARKEEVAMALRSQFSQRAQEQYQCQIARQPGPFQDVSNLEGAGMLKRFTTTISVTAMFTKTKAAEYYSTFLTPEVKSNG